MIDNMPFYTNDRKSMQNAYNSPLLIFVENTQKANTKTGEIYYINKRKYLNLSFTFKLNDKEVLQELRVRGSIHTFYNRGLHNANILTFKNLIKTLDKYSFLFGLDLSKCKLSPLENGTNIYLNDFSEYKVNDIIQNTHCEKRKMFNRNNGIETSLISGTSKSEVRIKFYSKSDDYPKYCTNTLRIEDKLTKIRGLNKKGIIYVSDLYKIENHIILFEKHLNNISNIVLYDYTMQIPKNSKFIKIARDFKNPIYWRKLINDCKNNIVYDTKYNEKVELLNSLSFRYGSNILKKIKQHIEDQSLICLGLCNFNLYKITKTPKNAPYKKLKNAQLYIRCIPCTYKVYKQCKEFKNNYFNLKLSFKNSSIVISKY